MTRTSTRLMKSLYLPRAATVSDGRIERQRRPAQLAPQPHQRSSCRNKRPPTHTPGASERSRRPIRKNPQTRRGASLPSRSRCFFPRGRSQARGTRGRRPGRRRAEVTGGQIQSFAVPNGTSSSSATFGHDNPSACSSRARSGNSAGHDCRTVPVRPSRGRGCWSIGSGLRPEAAPKNPIRVPPAAVTGRSRFGRHRQLDNEPSATITRQPRRHRVTP